MVTRKPERIAPRTPSLCFFGQIELPSRAGGLALVIDGPIGLVSEARSATRADCTTKKSKAGIRF
jgi:hypothetical protein